MSFVIFWDTFRSLFSLFCLCFILHLLRLFLIVHCTDIFSASFGSLGPPLHLLVLYLLSLSNTRSGFFCVLFPPLVLIYHLFRYITFKFSVRTPHSIFQQLSVISLTFTHLLYLLLTSWRSTFAVLSLMGIVLADRIQ